MKLTSLISLSGTTVLIVDDKSPLPLIADGEYFQVWDKGNLLAIFPLKSVIDLIEEAQNR